MDQLWVIGGFFAFIAESGPAVHTEFEEVSNETGVDDRRQ